MRAGDPAVCSGRVVHARRSPRHHEFVRPVSYAWFDPDRPGELSGQSRLWSSRWWAPVRFRRADYGSSPTGSLGEAARDDLEGVLGHRPGGEVRMLTQFRRLGWLFNPITTYVVWDADPETPVGVVLEVTNTPWRERHRYALALHLAGDPSRWPGGRRFGGDTAKVLHVSPFLDEDARYRVAVESGPPGAVPRRLGVSIDVLPVSAPGDPVVRTALVLRCDPATPRALRRDLLRRPLSTPLVSIGIHLQAARLAAKRVPFVAHPSKRGRP